jgi:hypothetical protein
VLPLILAWCFLGFGLSVACSMACGELFACSVGPGGAGECVSFCLDQGC